jgi:EpsI family protein
LVGHFSNMKWGVGDDHVVYGWVFFGITMFVLFWMGAKWRDAGIARHSLQDAAPEQVSPGRPLGGMASAVPATLGMRRAVLVASLAAIGLSYLVLSRLQDVTPYADFEPRARQALGAIAPGPLAVQPKFSGARASVQGILDTEHGTEIYMGYFARQVDGAEMIAFGNAVLPESDAGWRVVSRANRSVPIGATQLSITEWHLRHGSQERLLWSWYTIAGVGVASDYKAKALTAWSMLSGQGDHSMVTVLDTRLQTADGRVVGQSDAQTQDRARERLQAVAQRVQQVLPR